MPPPLDLPAEHAALVAQLRAEGRPYRGGIHNDSYSGSGRPFLNVGIPEMRRIVRNWASAHRAASAQDLIAMADRLNSAIRGAVGCLPRSLTIGGATPEAPKMKHEADEARAAHEGALRAQPITNDLRRLPARKARLRVLRVKSFEPLGSAPVAGSVKF